MKRDLDDGLLAGVCSGLQVATGVSALWFRLAFVLAFLWFGAGVLVYLVLWVLMAAAEGLDDDVDE